MAYDLGVICDAGNMRCIAVAQRGKVMVNYRDSVTYASEIVIHHLSVISIILKGAVLYFGLMSKAFVFIMVMDH